jgi:hypothetical protein
VAANCGRTSAARARRRERDHAGGGFRCRVRAGQATRVRGSLRDRERRDLHRPLRRYGDRPG